MQEALDKANLSERDLSAVAVTIGPGLSLCLRGNLNQVKFNRIFATLTEIHSRVLLRMS